MKKRIKVSFVSFYTWDIITWIPCVVIMSYDGLRFNFMFLAWRFDMIFFIEIADEVQAQVARRCNAQNGCAAIRKTTNRLDIAANADTPYRNRTLKN